MEHDFYNLDEAAKLLECTVLDLLKLGMAGKIDLCIKYRGQLDRYSIPDNAFTGRPAPEKNETVNEFLPILKENLEGFIHPHANRSNEKIYIEQIMWPGCNYPLSLLEENIFGDNANTQLVELTKDMIFIMKKTLDTLKTESHKSPAELGAPPPVGDDITTVLNPDHPWHSEYLAMVVKGWLELYSKREGNKEDNTFTPTGGHISEIQKWLKKSDPSLKITPMEYLAKVINPSKQGGPKKQQE